MGDELMLDDLIAEASESKDAFDKEWRALTEVRKELTRLQQKAKSDEDLIQKQGQAMARLELLESAAKTMLDGVTKKYRSLR